MLSFREFLVERIINLGFNDSGNKTTHAPAVHEIIRSSYKGINGYMGLGHGSTEESEAIHQDIHNTNHAIKVFRHQGKIKSAVIYKKDEKGNRKIIAAGTDGSTHGKHGLFSIMKDDHRMKRAWIEASGSMEHVAKKIGFNEIPPEKVQSAIKKHIEPLPDGGYIRQIAGHPHKKRALGTLKV